MRLLQHIILIIFFINSSWSKNLYNKNFKKRNEVNFDDDMMIEIVNDLENDENEIYNSNIIDQIIEFNVDEDLGSNNMDQNLNKGNEKEDEVIEIDFGYNGIENPVKPVIDENANNEKEKEKEKDTSIIIDTNPDLSKYKNTKVTFTPTFTPIKYLPDEEKEKLKQHKNDNAYISAGADNISNFSGFYNQLTSDEKTIYDKIVESSTKSPPELTVSVTITSSKNYKTFHDDMLDSAERVVSAVISDYTELWWIGSYRMGMSQSSPYLIQLKFQIDTGDTVNQVVNINKKFEIMKEDIIKRISDLNLTTNYAKLKFIHDYLITKIVYTFGRDHIRTLYGALVENKCVCEALANCGNNRGTIKCPSNSNYFCIDGDNVLYKSSGSQCKKVYYESLEKTIVFLKESGGYIEYTDEDTLDSSEFIIYECLQSDGINSGCTIYTEKYYHDKVNQHIYHLETNHQYKQLRGTSYVSNGDTYICNTEGVCAIDIFPGYYLAGTITSGKYNKLIHCTTSTSGRKTTTTCSNETKPTVNGYYINGSSGGKSLIECSNTSSSSPACYVSVPPNSIKTTGYGYLDAGNDNSSSSTYAGVIICTSTVCSSKDKPRDSSTLYYIDASVSSDTAIITCDNTSCRSGSGTLTNGYAYIDGSTDGNVLLSNGRKFSSVASGASSSLSKYYIDASNPKQIITCGYNSTSKKVICSSGTNNATGSTKTYFVDSGISGNIIECTTSTCTSKAPNVGYYITGNSEYPLLQCSNSSRQINCNALSKNDVQQAYYLDGSSTTDNKNYSKVIYCSSATSCSVITTTVKGYYIEGSSTSKAQLIYSDGSSYSLYSPVNVGYYLEGSSSTNGSDYTQVIYCSSPSLCSSVKTTYIGYYVDGSSATSTSSSSKKRATTTPTYSKLIVCDGTKYTAVTTTNYEGYYFDGSSTTNNTTYKKVIYCSSSATTCTPIATTIKGYYLDGTSTINNTDYNKLIVSDGSYYSSLTSINVGYYLNGNSSTNSLIYSKLIYCKSTTSCSTLENNRINEGFYLEGGTATNPTSYSQLITCKESSNVKTCAMHTTSSSSIPFDGYYVSGMQDKTQFPLINCISKSCDKVADNAINSGYYMEGSTSTSNGSNYTKVITCIIFIFNNYN
ncbi:scaffoldin [Piromyces sp. E2]|nr:scaffoldin [Piromyces sp. E2]|eukprot:OUM67209.1 scaffoldin [Piromyces sp. E2]